MYHIGNGDQNQTALKPGARQWPLARGNIGETIKANITDLRCESVYSSRCVATEAIGIGIWLLSGDDRNGTRDGQLKSLWFALSRKLIVN